MGRFTVIPQDTFESLQVEAGILLKRFNPAVGTFSNDDVITATTGGINAVCKPSYTDYGEDVDNCPNNTKELKHLDGWDCSLGFTAIKASKEVIRTSLGAADIDAQTGAIKPRRELRQTDFADVWWVGDRADGGLVAVQLKNALSTDGFSLQTTKNGKGQIAVTLTGHVSINAQDVMPMEFYSVDPEEIEAYNVTQMLSHVTSTFTDSGVESGEAFSTTLTAEDDYTIENVIVTMGGEDVTDSAYTSGTGVVAIASVTGNIVIIATATTA